MIEHRRIKLWDQHLDIQREHLLEIVVDIDKIASALGRKAVGNKTGRATTLHGAIIVNALGKQDR